jgi:hypothetical protein
MSTCLSLFLKDIPVGITKRDCKMKFAKIATSLFHKSIIISALVLSNLEMHSHCILSRAYEFQVCFDKHPGRIPVRPGREGWRDIDLEFANWRCSHVVFQHSSIRSNLIVYII